MKVLELRLHLQELRARFAPGTGDRVALDRIDTALRSLDEHLLVEFCDVLEGIASKLAKAGVAKAKSAAKSPVNELGVARYIDELNQGRDDNGVFEAIVKRLDKDKTIKMHDVIEIARRFAGEGSKPKTKKDALKVILQRQIADKRASARGNRVSDIF
jgi:hypothetical protein